MSVRPIRGEEVDSDASGEQRGRRSWPLGLVIALASAIVAWVGQLVGFGFWLGGISTEVHALTKGQDKGETAYVQKDVADARAAAFKDQVDELKRRLTLVECSQEGKKCRSD